MNRCKTLNDPEPDRARGNLFVVSAPSGGGKTSLIRAAIEATDDLGVSVSHTTRERRPEERDEVDYYFVDKPGFERMIADGAFLEHATVFDHYYGTSRGAVQNALERGCDVVLDIDWQGARMVREAAADTVTIFILPPSIDELERRLQKRGGDTAEVIERRMRDAVTEMSHFDEYDYLVINDDFERAVAALTNIINAARFRTPVQYARYTEMLSQLVAG